MPTSNSPAARRNAARPTRPALMRLLLDEEALCEYCQTNHATIREPKNNGSGGYRSVCLDCIMGSSREDRLADLRAMMDALD